MTLRVTVDTVLTEKAWIAAQLDSGSTSAVSDATGVATFLVRISAATSGLYTLSLNVEGVAPLKVGCQLVAACHMDWMGKFPTDFVIIDVRGLAVIDPNNIRQQCDQQHSSGG